MVAATSSQDVCFDCAALPASQQITVPNPTEVSASYSSICLRGAGAGGSGGELASTSETLKTKEIADSVCKEVEPSLQIALRLNLPSAEPCRGLSTSRPPHFAGLGNYAASSTGDGLAGLRPVDGVPITH
jgi:hypothetical protein